MKRNEVLAALIITATKISGCTVTQIMIAGMNPTSATFYQINTLVTNIIPTYMGIVSLLFSNILNEVATIEEIINYRKDPRAQLATEKRESLNTELTNLLKNKRANLFTQEQKNMITKIKNALTAENFSDFEPDATDISLLTNMLAIVRTQMGRVYQANILVSMMLSASTYPIIGNVHNILSHPFAKQFEFSSTDLQKLQQGINLNYFIIPLMGIYNTDTQLFFQNKNVANAVIITLANYAIGLPLTYLAVHHMELDFLGIMIADALSYAAGVLMAKLIQIGATPASLQTYFPHMRAYKLFDLSTGNRIEYIKESITRGWAYVLAELSLSFTTAFVGINPQFNSVSLNGGLVVLQNAATSISQQATNIAAPYVAEKLSGSRNKVFFYQIILGMLAPLIITGVGVPFARSLSQTLGGESTNSVSEKLLQLNVVTVMMDGLLFGLLQMAFQNLVNLGETISTGLAVTAGLLISIPLLYLFKNALPASQEQAIGNYSLMGGTFFSLCTLLTYAYCTRKKSSVRNNMDQTNIRRRGSFFEPEYTPENGDTRRASLIEDRQPQPSSIEDQATVALLTAGHELTTNIRSNLQVDTRNSINSRAK